MRQFSNRARFLVVGACLLVFLASVPAKAQFGGGGGFPLPIGLPQIVILILADDVGQDVLGMYDLGGACSVSGTLCQSKQDCPGPEKCDKDYAITPVLDSLGEKLGDPGNPPPNEPVIFHNAWSNPVCSPTRATIQTGRHGFRTGIGSITGKASINSLPLNELAIPEILDALPAPVAYDVKHAAIGKWHLTSFTAGSEDHPRELGYDYYAGAMFNLNGESFFNWTKHVNGVQQPAMITDYATTDNVNDALAWIDSVTPDGTPQDPLPLMGYQPLFLYLPFNAAHSPWEAPLDDLLSQETIDRLRDFNIPEKAKCSTGEEKRACFLAAIEAMDTEIGRLLDGLPDSALPHTTVIFLGDNGTPKPVTVAPFDSGHAKGSLFQGGINVPMMVWGSAVLNGDRHSYDLVNTADLFGTVLEMATGFAMDDLLPSGHVHDSVSLRPILEDISGTSRNYTYAEGFDKAGPGLEHRKAIRDAQFKLIRQKDGTEGLYDLDADPFETNPLPICAPGHDCQADPNDPCCAYDGEYDNLAAELDSLAATQTACPLGGRCEDFENCQRATFSGGVLPCDEVSYLTFDCQRPHPDGESFVSCVAPTGTFAVEKGCPCEPIDPSQPSECPAEGIVLTGLERADGSGESCWSDVGF